ncbi:MAG: VWA domain-containing protein, partial [Ktedonobacterales bacterium]|nr:VWA domain-containing protein [Ktedonobacterales bacterium]
MTRILHRTGAVLIVLACTLGALAFLPLAPAYAATPRAANGHVTIIVLDMSGSMNGNDPNGNRCSAANAYIDLSGPGNFIGIVGLDDNTGKTAGPHNYTQAQVWAQPTEMATVASRKALQGTIAAKSNNCKPDGNTPTYDALNKALGLLQSSATGGVTGSVILLTDGVPAPDTSSQVANIRKDLVPQFKAKGWPIDTIALGPAGAQDGVDFHAFLGDIASATAGKFY